MSIADRPYWRIGIGIIQAAIYYLAVVPVVFVFLATLVWIALAWTVGYERADVETAAVVFALFIIARRYDRQRRAREEQHASGL